MLCCVVLRCIALLSLCCDPLRYVCVLLRFTHCVCCVALHCIVIRFVLLRCVVYKFSISSIPSMLKLYKVDKLDQPHSLADNLCTSELDKLNHS